MCMHAYMSSIYIYIYSFFIPSQNFPLDLWFPFIGNILTSSLGNCFEWYHSYVQKGFKTSSLWRHWVPNAGFMFEALNDSYLVSNIFLSPPLPCQVPSGSLVDLFGQMEWDDQSRQWEGEADLRKVITYLRGSKLLRIPTEWRAVIPTNVCW